MGIGMRIKEERKRAGMTQPELAERIGVHETTIRRWEQERDKGPDAVMVQKIADVLGVSASDLLGEDAPTAGQGMLPPVEKAMITLENGRKLEAPATPDGYAFLERLFAMSLGEQIRELGSLGAKSAAVVA